MCTWWILKAKERICEWQESDETEGGWSYVNDKMMTVVRSDHIYNKHINTRTYYLIVKEYVLIQKEYEIMD